MTAMPPPSSWNQPQPWRDDITTYLWQSILVTIFCCLPFGIVGIVFAAQTSSHLDVGDYTRAAESSAKAKMWTTISFVVGIIGIVIGVLIQMAARKR